MTEMTSNSEQAVSQRCVPRAPAAERNRDKNKLYPQNKYPGFKYCPWNVQLVSSAVSHQSGMAQLGSARWLWHQTVTTSQNCGSFPLERPQRQPQHPFLPVPLILWSWIKSFPKTSLADKSCSIDLPAPGGSLGNAASVLNSKARLTWNKCRSYSSVKLLIVWVSDRAGELGRVRVSSLWGVEF